MYTLDANIFVRDLDPRHPDHNICRDLLKRIHTTATPIIVPLLLLVEVGGAISREFRDPMRGRLAIMVLREFPNTTFVVLDDRLAQDAADIAADYGIREADAVYVAVARHSSCTLVTIDREQRERAAPIVAARTPAEILAGL